MKENTSTFRFKKIQEKIKHLTNYAIIIFSWYDNSFIPHQEGSLGDS
jgi:hypothetical protein